MPRWTAIASDDLRAAGYGTILDSAEATPVGNVAPVQDAIASAVARVRRAVSAGNAVDVDATKVPLSLKDVAVRIALFRLMELIGLALSDDQKQTKRDDQADLKLITDRKVRVEAPDTADATAVPQNRGNWDSENKLIMRTHPLPSPGQQLGQPGRGYANPDAPEDNT